MTRRVAGCLATWLFVFPAVTLLPERSEAALQTTSPLVICLGQPVPTGYVITAISHTAKCGSALGPNTMTLKTYAGLASFVACGPITISGYLVTKATTTSACQGINVVINDKTVTMPTYNTVTMTKYTGLKTVNNVCAPQNIPTGYVVTKQTLTAACKPMAGALTAWNTMTLTLYTGLQTFTACMPLNPIPSGYVVVRQLRLAACNTGALGNNAVELKKL
jgi:hypothetical protein